MKKQSKHQNHTWQRCWNYQTKHEYTKGSNGQSRQHARTDEQFKQADENAKKKMLRNARDKIYCNINERYFDGLIGRIETAKEIIFEVRT